MEENGGTRFVLYRKDRVRFIAGAGRLREFRLTPASTTRRIVATCCRTPMFLEFQTAIGSACMAACGRGHAAAARAADDDGRPPGPLRLSGDIRNSRWQSAAFFAKLFGAWVAMGFRSPRITEVNGEIDA